MLPSPARLQELRNPRTAALIWVAIALLVRLAYLWEASQSSVLFWHPSLDEREMQIAAEGLLSGRGFGPEPLFKAPLYPLFLSGVIAVAGDAWPFWTRLLQHLGGTALVALTFDLSRRLAGPRRGVAAGHVAAGLLALNGPLIRLEGSLLLDFPFTLMVTATVWAVVRERTARGASTRLQWALAAGALAALAWLLRPTITVLLPVLTASLLLARGNGTRSSMGRAKRGQGLRLALAFSLAPALAFGAVFVRNQMVGREGMILPWQGGYNLYEANRLGANGRYLLQTRFANSETGNPTRALAEQGFREAVARGEAVAASQGTFAAINSYWTGKALREIREAPSRWGALMLRKLVYLASDREIYNVEVYEVQRSLSPILSRLPVTFGWVLPLALLSLFALPRTPKRRRGSAALVWCAAGTLALAIALYYASGRLRMPLLPLLAALGGAGAASLLPLRASRRSVDPQRVVAAIAVSLGLVAALGDWWGVRSESLAHVEYARLSRAAYAADRFDLALSYADRAEAASPGYPTLPALRGQAFFGMQQYPAAAKAFREATAAIPNDPVAPYNLGSILHLQLGQPQPALAAYREALRRDSSYHRAAWSAAMVAVQLGRTTEAAQLLQGHLPTKLDERTPRPLLTSLAALHLARQEDRQARDVLDLVRKGGGPDALAAAQSDLRSVGL